jgi:hypothetical protein
MSKNIETKDNEKKVQIVSEHVPLSVSILSNVPEYGNKPILFVIVTLKTYLNNFIKLSSKNY